MCRHRLGLYRGCQISEVLLGVADDIPHSEDRAVGVVDHVKVTLTDIILSDVRKEVPSANKHINMSALNMTIILKVRFNHFWARH